MTSSSHNIELEAAKFLHKLIQDSKDEPAKLATKLYVVMWLHHSVYVLFCNFELYSCALTLFILSITLDIAAHENQWKGKHNALSSHI